MILQRFKLLQTSVTACRQALSTEGAATDFDICSEDYSLPTLSRLQLSQMALVQGL